VTSRTTVFARNDNLDKHFGMVYKMNSMLESILLCSDDAISSEIFDVVSHIPHLAIFNYTTIDHLENGLAEKSVQFIIIADEISGIFQKLSSLNEKYPHIYFIYFRPTLNVDNFQYSDLSYFSHIIIGEHRISGLSETLLQLTREHWKKIPYDKFDLVFERLSPRLKKVMNYIETHDLKECGTNQIAKYLDISSGYFSQEFKKDTKLTFREFMQRLLDHYEFIILDSLDLSAKSASQLLGYSELSSFSRSFKKRKGYPPSQRKIHKYIAS
jgi:YesN/AraC family two-component response regulator